VGKRLRNIGDIATGSELGNTKMAKKVWQECPDCKYQRWIDKRYYDQPNHTGRCNKCSIEGSLNPKWTGGEYITSSGYKKILKKGHPLSDRDGHIFEHRYVVCEKYGTGALIDRVVHHIDGDKLNNNIENLEIMTMSEHTKHHHGSI